VILSSYDDISDIYQMLGQPDQALKTLEQRLAFDRKVGDRKQEKLTLFVISRLYQQQRQYDQALAALQKVYQLIENLAIALANNLPSSELVRFTNSKVSTSRRLTPISRL
jgi:tetratricopeptide (TPR) repeat protein